MALHLARAPETPDERKSRALPADQLRSHVMASKDTTTMTGVCRICGPVGLYKHGRYYYCETKARHTRESHLLWRYGITETEFEALVQANGPLCRICQREPDLFHVDHNHDTGAVRGVLCGDCNRGIGIFGDDPERLAAAIAYLKGVQ